ncbi:hypothetical protein BpHYR1_001899 [Brachionus plicatilis]|uniref:Uncharacterized protein n=1 Tax=Brachionus plicatilis TaxID=10195 RepID=A0A3M7SJA9_BRAPC|nr:hypothetical protein BpHYR1_001899 [Brachionus plicatilis]
MNISLLQTLKSKSISESPVRDLLRKAINCLVTKKKKLKLKENQSVLSKKQIQRRVVVIQESDKEQSNDESNEFRESLPDGITKASLIYLFIHLFNERLVGDKKVDQHPIILNLNVNEDVNNPNFFFHQLLFHLFKTKSRKEIRRA